MPSGTPTPATRRRDCEQRTPYVTSRADVRSSRLIGSSSPSPARRTRRAPKLRPGRVQVTSRDLRSLFPAVRVAASVDVETLSEVLARAFRNDPVHRWLFPDERAWSRHSRRSFSAILEHELRHETVFTTAKLEGAAVWRDPELGPPKLWERIRTALRFMPMLGRRSLSIGRALEQLMALHPEAPHWYLAVLGTDPDQQGKGVGSALMAPILSRCDTSARSAYLEASRRENVPYYERHGFHVVGEFEIPEGPTVWRMVRKPRG